MSVCIWLPLKAQPRSENKKLLIFFWHVQGLAHQSPATPGEARAGGVFDTAEELGKENLGNS